MELILDVLHFSYPSPSCLLPPAKGKYTYNCLEEKVKGKKGMFYDKSKKLKFKGVGGVKNFRTFDLRFGQARVFVPVLRGGYHPQRAVVSYFINRTRFFYGFSSYTL